MQMKRQVALLRGINVGRAKRVAMADLRALVEGLGYTDVRTLLNSGNVLFTAPDAPGESAARMEAALAERLGISSRILALTAEELATVVAENPLAEIAENPSRLLVGFLFDPEDRKRVEPLLKEDWGSESLAVGSRAVYYWCPNGVLEGALAPAIGRVLGDAVTARNWSTVQKLHALAPASASPPTS
ncbi:MAG TPA: DUF1697 domain-containing protein [Longimicrobiaceae bacterium]|nr:DUF1697 domain-containing protein [Longimicrobiaceae bacterium]